MKPTKSMELALFAIKSGKLTIIACCALADWLDEETVKIIKNHENTVNTTDLDNIQRSVVPRQQ